MLSQGKHHKHDIKYGMLNALHHKAQPWSKKKALQL